ncbi:MAG: hypothetical protein K2W82_01840 [Candidatus Obscuribacterales bacterium]|nr:hypothetical protein [Candidatus Obscuribacterales bacterium]
MSFNLKIILAVVPVLIAGYVLFSLFPPVWEEVSSKSKVIEEKQGEKSSLDDKLATRGKLIQRKRKLEQSISMLRESVPKNPDLEMFNLDLEKMCEKAGVDLISIAPPKENKKKAGAKETFLGKKEDDSKTKAKDDKNKTATEPPKPQSELSEFEQQVVLTGSFNGLQKLLHELETYQRVVKVKELISHIPKRDDKAQALPADQQVGADEEPGDPEHLYISLRIIAYYSP